MDLLVLEQAPLDDEALRGPHHAPSFLQLQLRRYNVIKDRMVSPASFMKVASLLFGATAASEVSSMSVVSSHCSV